MGCNCEMLEYVGTELAVDRTLKWEVREEFCIVRVNMDRLGSSHSNLPLALS